MLRILLVSLWTSGRIELPVILKCQSDSPVVAHPLRIIDFDDLEHLADAICRPANFVFYLHLRRPLKAGLKQSGLKSAFISTTADLQSSRSPYSRPP